MATSYTASAPGKAIIHGEHAVVYGKAAVAASVNLRTRVTCTEEESFVVFEYPNNYINKSWPVSHFLCFSVPEEGYSTKVIPSTTLVPTICNYFKVYAGCAEFKHQSQLAFLYLFAGITLRYNNGQFAPAKFSVSSEVPLAASLGSSSSFSTALAAVLLARYEVVRHPLSSDDRALISAWALQAECIQHGQPAGPEHTVSAYGGAILFRGGKVIDTLQSIPFYKVLLVNTQFPRSTRIPVAAVKYRHDKYAEVIKPVLDSIDAISETFWKLLKDSLGGAEIDIFPKAVELVRMNQCLLNCLGVGHWHLDQVAEAAAARGLASKLTGAGSGGCALVLCEAGKPHVQGPVEDRCTLAVRKELERDGFVCREVDLGCPGVTLE